MHASNWYYCEVAVMTMRLSHAEYKELFQQLLQREELGYATTKNWIEVALPSRQLCDIKLQVYLRGKLLTFFCPCLLRLQQKQEAEICALLSVLNRTYPDIKFIAAQGCVQMLLQSFILKDRMVCQCLLVLKRLADVLDKVYPELKCALKK